MSNSTTAKTNNSSRTSSRRSRKSQEVNLQKPATIGSTENSQKPSENTNNGDLVLAMPTSTSQPSAITPLPGNRPIDSSNLRVLGTISVMGDRPVVASHIKIWDTMTISGARPIATSSLHLSEVTMLIGNRPIASNYLDGSEDLMGYID